MKKYVLMGIIFIAALLASANTVNITLVSNADVIVYGPIDHYAPLGSLDWGPGKNAVPTWTHPLWPPIPGSSAVWVSSSYLAEGNVAYDSWRKFEVTLKVPCVAYNIVPGVVTATSDNAEEVYLNGVLLGADGEIQGAWVDNFEFATLISYYLPSLQAGLNKIEFIVRNYGQAGYATTNPTGLLFEVTGVWYEIPNVVWQPPIANSRFEPRDGATLPIKFELYLQDGTLVTESKSLELRVYKGACPNAFVGEPVHRWSLGEGVENLRFDPNEACYIANFKTKDYSLEPGATYSAIVYDGCTQQPLGCISFQLGDRKGNGANR